MTHFGRAIEEVRFVSCGELKFRLGMLKRKMLNIGKCIKCYYWDLNQVSTTTGLG